MMQGFLPTQHTNFFSGLLLDKCVYLMHNWQTFVIENSTHWFEILLRSKKTITVIKLVKNVTS